MTAANQHQRPEPVGVGYDRLHVQRPGAGQVKTACVGGVDRSVGDEIGPTEEMDRACAGGDGIDVRISVIARAGIAVIVRRCRRRGRQVDPLTVGQGAIAAVVLIDVRKAEAGRAEQGNGRERESGESSSVNFHIS